MATVSCADTTTNRLRLVLPTIGSANWGQKINNDMQLIDSTVGALGQTNAFTSTQTFSGYTQFTSTVNLQNLRNGSGYCLGVNSSSNVVVESCTSGSNYIAIQSTLQGGAVFNVSSGTVSNLSTTNLKFSDGSVQTIAANGSDVILLQNTLQAGATFYVSSGTVAQFYASSGTFGSGAINPIYKGPVGIVLRSGYEIAAATNTTSAPDFSVQSSGQMRLGVHRSQASVPTLTFGAPAVNANADPYLSTDGAANSALTLTSIAGVAIRTDPGSAAPLYASTLSIGTDWGNYEGGTSPGNDTNVAAIYQYAVQIGTSTSGSSANSELTVLGTTSQTYDIAVGTASATSQFHLAVSTSAHVITNGPSPSISSCGTTPSGSVVGDDNQGIITIGGGSVTACTLAFANSWGATPVCVISDNSTAITGDISSISATGFTSSFSLSLGGGKVYYRCGCTGSSCR